MRTYSKPIPIHQFQRLLISIDPPLRPEYLSVVSIDRSIPGRHPWIHPDNRSRGKVKAVNRGASFRHDSFKKLSYSWVHPQCLAHTGLEVRHLLCLIIRHVLGQLTSRIKFEDLVCALLVRERILAEVVEERSQRNGCCVRSSKPGCSSAFACLFTHDLLPIPGPLELVKHIRAAMLSLDVLPHLQLPRRKLHNIRR